MENNIKVEDLHPKYQAIAKIIGLENTIKLGREIGGELFYLPKWNSPLSPFIKQRNLQIVKEYNGHNVKDLAKKNNVTTFRIYQILRKARKNKPASLTHPEI